VISKPHEWSHDWVRQTPQSFETTVLDIPQMTSRPRGASHDWVQQTPQSFEITILESIIKHRIQIEFQANLKNETKECAFVVQEHTPLQSPIMS
jgi:2-C-methyl-D-erythritol 4-phosphate cytidylyltransferase